MRRERLIIEQEVQEEARLEERQPDQELMIVKTEHQMSFAKVPDPKPMKAKPKKRISLFVEKKRRKELKSLKIYIYM